MAMTLETMRNRLANVAENSKYLDGIECQQMVECLNAHLSAQAKVQVTDSDAIELLRTILGGSYDHLSGECLVDAKYSARTYLEDFAARLSQGAPTNLRECTQWSQGAHGEAVAIEVELVREPVYGGIHIRKWTAKGKIEPGRYIFYTHTAPPSVLDGWLPIETAPDDGTPHVRGLHVFSDGDFLYWDAVAGHIDPEDGIFYDEGGDVIGWDAMDFTHWHPLSAAPTLAGKGGA